ncbi:MFS transporter [Geodermatophilus marinus]|uniref:MFS transporter n=1 Tax=Geodermatophilus sp. LHW52908 TaxID=2303986 RepID=UPI000E3B85B1|nr:MFS transporter [Geodermatophilus sp. LHW52908]RFU20868.1 MFS transporter [Geodermatophilus sp. LHW52908]
MTTPGSLRLTLPFLPVAGALFCIQLDFFSLALALPTIATDLGSTTTDLQWLLSGYMIALGSLLIPAARSGDVLGRRRVLLLGTTVFGATSLVCGLASAVPVLIGARVVQGLGAAMIMPTALALVTNATTEDVRPRITGALLGLAGVGTALGPVVGGVLASEVSWRWVFLLNVPIAALAFWGVLRLPGSRDESGPRTLRQLDWWGVVSVVAGLALVSVAIDDVGVEGWTSPVTVVPLVAGLALLAAFAVVETRTAAPLVRPSLVRDRVFLVLAVAGTIANIGTCVYIVLATLELQDVRGYSAAAAGLVFFASSLGLALCGPLSGPLSVHFPAGIVMGVAVLLAAPALALLAVAGPLPVYVVALTLCGLTTGMGYSLGQVAVQNVLPPARSAEVTSVLLTVLISVGGVGVVAATAVVEAVGGGRATTDGIELVLGVLAAVLLVAGVVTLVAAARRLRAAAASGRPGRSRLPT